MSQSEVSRDRSRNYWSQVKGSVVFKGLAVACSFLLIPLMIHYLGQAQYGVWSTLLSVMVWLTFFDLGLGNGLRNKVAESLAKDEVDEAQRYISLAYSFIGLIAFLVFAVLSLAAFFVPWQRVFNTQLLSAETLSIAVLITGFFIALNFWVSLINSVLNAVQKTSLVVVGQFIISALSLVFVYALTKTTNASLLYLATVYGVALVGANTLVSVWFYKGNIGLIPKLLLDFSHIRPLLNLGLQFFVIQTAMLVIFTTDKVLITQFFGPEYVAGYDVVFKLFSIISIIYGLIAAPLWSSYADAYHRGDNVWIKVMLRKQLVLFLVVIIAVGIMISITRPVIAIWIGHDLEVQMPLVFAMGIFVLVSTWNNIFAFILGGINKIRLDSYYTVLTAALNIPFSYFFAITLQFGVAGITLGTITSISISAIISPLRVYYFIYTEQSSKFLSSVLK